MPELPEVETIRRDLQSLLAGRRIVHVEILDDRILTGFLPSGRPRRRVSVAAFQSVLIGKVLGEVHRRGKYLVLLLSSGQALLGHLRMTGQIILGPPDLKARARIHFDGMGSILNFCDTRRFGELWLADDWTQDPSIRALGPEPLSNGWDAEAWGRGLRRSKAKIQAALLDQRRLAGLGNIYVTEALFLTGVRPTRRCHTIRRETFPGLLANIRAVLEEGVRNRGVSFYSYRDASGQKGGNQRHLWVYGRGGQACRSCGSPLKETKVSGRGTVYCPVCQK